MELPKQRCLQRFYAVFYRLFFGIITFLEEKKLCEQQTFNNPTLSEKLHTPKLFHFPSILQYRGEPESPFIVFLYLLYANGVKVSIQYPRRLFNAFQLKHFRQVLSVFQLVLVHAGVPFGALQPKSDCQTCIFCSLSFFF